MTALVATLGSAQAHRVTGDRAGRVILRKTTLTLAAALAQNDTIDLIYLPKRHVLVPHLCRIVSPELDTHGTPTGTIDIGVAGVADNIYDGLSMDGALDAVPNVPVTANAIAVADTDGLVQALVKTAVATGATSGVISFWLAYQAV